MPIETTHSKIEDENKVYLVEDIEGVDYCVVAMSESEARSFIEEEIQLRENSLGTYIKTISQVDPSITPAYDEAGNQQGFMISRLDEKGIHSCSEW